MTMKNAMWAVLVVGLAAAVQASTLEERIQPVGKVCVEGDASCAVAAVAASSGPRSGADVYNASCMACHGTGAAGAPKLGDAAAWAPRIGKGIDVLYTNAINGFAGMPPRGTCMNCSDDELHAAVDHILAASK